MAKRIQQSRRHGHYDPQSTGRIHIAGESDLPVDQPEDTPFAPPTLTLVGGTDVEPTSVEPLAAPRI
jgi:hypothetical protein